MFPHTLKVKGGTNVTFDNDTNFHKYLLDNPESNSMWGDHKQLQITANMYNGRLNILTINHDGKGSIVKEPFMPDTRLAKFATLPADQTETRDMLLMYSNGNHYDALIGKDHHLLTMGTISDMDHEEIERDTGHTKKLEEKDNSEHED